MSGSFFLPLRRLNVAAAIASWLAVTTGAFLYCAVANERSRRKEADDGSGIDKDEFRYGLIASLLFFNNLNVLIALCEIALGNHIGIVGEDYRKLRRRYGCVVASEGSAGGGGDSEEGGEKIKGGGEVAAALDFLFMPLPWTRLFDGKLWCRMWSTYALYDPSYQNPESFGFFIDVGNGYSTILPCLLMNVAVSNLVEMSPLLVGCVCLATYWQILYGTIVYFLSFFYNRRYEGKNLVEVVGFVGVSNGIWFVFPLVGIYACVRILNDKDFSVFGY